VLPRAVERAVAGLAMPGSRVTARERMGALMGGQRMMAILAVIALLTFGSAIQVDAKKGPKVDPSIFNARTARQATDVCGDPDTATHASNKQVATADWEKHAGIATNGKSKDYGLILEKKVATSECAAAQAEVKHVAGEEITALGFTVRADAYCGAGAPRFNLVTEEHGDTPYFFGCNSGMQTTDSFTDANGVEWLVKEADLGAASGQTITGIEIIQDEQGRTVLDDITINDTVIGGPKE
jgi:hypothetical protein